MGSCTTCGLELGHTVGFCWLVADPNIRQGHYSVGFNLCRLYLWESGGFDYELGMNLLIVLEACEADRVSH